MRPLRLFGLQIVMLLAACSSSQDETGPGATVGCTGICPGTGTVDGSIRSSGATQDWDGYTVTIDGVRPISVATEGRFSWLDVTAGERSLAIGGLSPQCTVEGGNPQTLTVQRFHNERPILQINCATDLRGYIAYAVQQSENAIGIWAALPSGEHRFQIIPEVGRNYFPSISPDGRFIAFTRGDQLWKANADGSEARELFRTPNRAFAPSWSPDGQSILFYQITDEVQGTSAIGVVDSGGRNQRAFQGKSAHASDPVWSPDGAEIAYLTSNGIRRMLADGGRDTLILSGFTSSLSWSSSNRLLFRLDYSQFVTADPDGGNVYRIPGLGTFENSSGWDPTGTQIIYRNDSGEIMLADAVSGARRPIPLQPGSFHPTWR